MFLSEYVGMSVFLSERRCFCRNLSECRWFLSEYVGMSVFLSEYVGMSMFLSEYVGMSRFLSGLVRISYLKSESQFFSSWCQNCIQLSPDTAIVSGYVKPIQ